MNRTIKRKIRQLIEFIQQQLAGRKTVYGIWTLNVDGAKLEGTLRGELHRKIVVYKRY